MIPAKEGEFFAASNQENFRVARTSVVTKKNYSGGIFGPDVRHLIGISTVDAVDGAAHLKRRNEATPYYRCIAPC
jgi:hypothetical protein